MKDFRSLLICLFGVLTLSCGSKTKLGKLFEFEKYQELRVQTVLELVVDEGSEYSDILINNQSFPLNAYVQHDNSWKSVDVSRIHTPDLGNVTIANSEVGQNIELLVKVPKEYQSSNVVLFFQLQIDQSPSASLTQSTNVSERLETLSIASPGIRADANPTVLLSIASTLAVKFAQLETGDVAFTKEKLANFSDLTSLIRTSQKDLQDNIKREEALDTKVLIENLFARISNLIQTDETLKAKAVDFVKTIIPTPEKAAELIQSTASTIVEARESATNENPIFTTPTESETPVSPIPSEPSTPPAVADTTPPAAPVVSGVSPTQSPTWSWSAVTEAVSYRYKLNDSDLNSGASETNGLTFSPSSPLNDGTYVLYVQARDAAGNWSSSGSLSLIVDLTAASPVLSGYPTGTSFATSLNVIVAGSDLMSYQFKVGVSSSTTCSQSAGYSSSLPLANAITESIALLADVSLTLCVKGIDSLSNEAITEVSWVKATPTAPTGTFSVSKPAAVTWMYPRSNDSSTGSTVFGGKLHFLVNTNLGIYMGRASVTGVMDGTFGIAGWMKVSDMSNPSSVSISAVTLLRCANRLFGFDSSRLFEYDMTSTPVSLVLRHDFGPSAGAGGGVAPMSCLEDRYITAASQNNSTQSNAYLIYDTTNNLTLADKSFAPDVGQYPTPLRDPSSGTWYILYGTKMQALDSQFDRSGPIYTFGESYGANVGGEANWALRRSELNGETLTLMFAKGLNIRFVRMSFADFVSYMLGGSLSTIPASSHMTRAVANVHAGSSFAGGLYGCAAAEKSFYMVYTNSGSAYTFAFGLYGSNGQLSTAYNNGVELTSSVDPYNSYSGRNYVSITCAGDFVSFIRPVGNPFTSTTLNIDWIDASL